MVAGESFGFVAVTAHIVEQRSGECGDALRAIMTAAGERTFEGMKLGKKLFSKRTRHGQFHRRGEVEKREYVGGRRELMNEGVGLEKVGEAVLSPEFWPEVIEAREHLAGR